MGRRDDGRFRLVVVIRLVANHWRLSKYTGHCDRIRLTGSSRADPTQLPFVVDEPQRGGAAVHTPKGHQ